MPKQIDTSVLEMALVGYQAELQKITASMTAIRKQLGVRGGGVGTVSKRTYAKHHVSVAGLKHIAEAQRKRWAKFHAKRRASPTIAKKAAPKTKMSAERKAALVANLAKARAAKAEKAKAAVA